MPGRDRERKQSLIEQNEASSFCSISKAKNNRTVFFTAAIVFVVDFVVKTYLREYFAFTSTPVIKNIFHITVVFNKGAAFSLLSGKTNFLIYTGVIFILLFLLFLKSEKRRDALFMVSCGLILGGAISNLCDRITLGYVVDYFDFRVWPVFNISDSCITTGTGLLLIDSFKKTKNN
jgi:signal peptidase II